jgi:hypothetical protein
MNPGAASSPNVRLLVQQHVANNLAECEQTIIMLETKLAEAKREREDLRAIAKAAGVTLDAPRLLAAAEDVPAIPLGSVAA